MSDYARPTSEEFRAAALENFGFLSSVHGFRLAQSKLPYDPNFSALFTCGYGFIAVEGISYGFALAVRLGTLNSVGAVEQAVYLNTLLKMRDPTLALPRFGGTRGQVDEMAFSAQVLVTTAPDVLAGDFSVVRVAALVEKEAAEAYRLEQAKADHSRLASQASAEFHSGNYAQAAALLSRIDGVLTPAESALLALTTKRAKGTR
jgi:hypothetical protein